MNLWTRIKQLNIKQLWSFSILFLKHPLFIFPTIKATKRTFKICSDHFGNSHHKSNAANAFRHVLWNVLICSYSYKRTKNKQKSVFWAQNITDYYEKVTQNKPLDKAMDLHNNAVGRIHFLNLLDTSEEEMVSFLLKNVKNAQKFDKIQEIEHFRHKMIFIED